MAISNTEIASKLSDIATLIQDAKRWAAVQPGTSLDAHLATYVDVCLLGVLEESIEILFRERAHKLNDSYIADYICKEIKESFRNPKRQNIGATLRIFNPTFSEAFYKKFTEKCSEIEALDGINTVKQNLAHMGAYDLKLTLQDVESYFNRVKPILEEIEVILS